MKTIKIFLASSNELKDDRIAFGNLVRQLDNIYIKLGIHIQLVVWEELDLAYNNRRKQDEYDEKVRQSDIFVALFHTQAGQFTREEFNVALDENSKRKVPQMLIFYRELQPGEEESPELVEFKHRLEKDLEHFCGRYSTNDKMHLDFVLWLQRTESTTRNALKVEDNNVTLGGVPIARMSQLPFVAENEDYKVMQEKLTSIEKEVEQLRQAVEQMPNMTALKKMLQQKLDELNGFKKNLENYQASLLDTAKRIAEMQFEKVNGILCRAMEAFEHGNLERANALLDEISHEADSHIERLEQDRALVHQDIDAFQLQTRTVMVDVNNPIGDRVSQVIAIFAKADDWAQRSAYEQGKYAELLLDYAEFLQDYAYYKDAERIYLRQISMAEELYGIKHPYTAMSYNNIGAVYSNQGNNTKALEYYFKAMSINEQVLGANHPNTATSYNNIGAIYDSQGDYAKALEFFQKALDIKTKVFGKDHSETATAYNNIGAIFCNQGNFTKALECFSKVVSIHEQMFDTEHSGTATTSNNIGMVYSKQEDYAKSLEYYLKALSIDEQVLGPMHPSTATDYNNVGYIYYCQGDNAKALEYYLKALSIHEQVLGTNHYDTATSYNNIGAVYSSQGDYTKALDYYFKALNIDELVLGSKHLDTATSYSNIGAVYDIQKDYTKALEYYFKALSIHELVLGPEHIDTGTSYNNIGEVYYRKGEFSKALEYYLKALEIKEHVLGKEHLSVATSYNSIGTVYDILGDFTKAIEYYSKALAVFDSLLGSNHPKTKVVCDNIEAVEEAKKQL